MSPTVWIALASLAFMIVAQAVIVAFALGGLFRDVKTLGEERRGSADCKAELAVLNSKFADMLSDVAEIAKDVKGLLTGAVPVRHWMEGDK